MMKGSLSPAQMQSCLHTLRQVFTEVTEQGAQGHFPIHYSTTFLFGTKTAAPCWAGGRMQVVEPSSLQLD